MLAPTGETSCLSGLSFAISARVYAMVPLAKGCFFRKSIVYTPWRPHDPKARKVVIVLCTQPVRQAEARGHSTRASISSSQRTATPSDLIGAFGITNDDVTRRSLGPMTTRLQR